jgi:hypothetical protein
MPLGKLIGCVPAFRRCGAARWFSGGSRPSRAGSPVWPHDRSWRVSCAADVWTYHHDHLQDRAKAICRQDDPWPEDLDARRQLVQAIDSCRALIERFSTALICNDCNAAEGAAKLALKAEIHADFSFSPREIAQFIKAKPGQSH